MFLATMEVLCIIKPYALLAQNRVVEKQNISQDTMSEQLDPTKLIEIDQANKEIEIAAPDTSNHSTLLNEYQNQQQVSVNDDTVVIKATADNEVIVDEDQKDVELISNQKEVVVDLSKNEQILYNIDSTLPKNLNQDNPIEIKHQNTVIKYLPLNYEFNKAISTKNQVTYNTNARNTVFNYYLTNKTFKEEILMFAPQRTYEFKYKIEVTKGSVVEENNRIFVLNDNINDNKR